MRVFFLYFCIVVKFRYFTYLKPQVISLPMNGTWRTEIRHVWSMYVFGSTNSLVWFNRNFDSWNRLAFLRQKEPNQNIDLAWRGDWSSLLLSFLFTPKLIKRSLNSLVVQLLVRSHCTGRVGTVISLSLDACCSNTDTAVASFCLHRDFACPVEITCSFRCTKHFVFSPECGEVERRNEQILRPRTIAIPWKFPNPPACLASGLSLADCIEHDPKDVAFGVKTYDAVRVEWCLLPLILNSLKVVAVKRHPLF